LRAGPPWALGLALVALSFGAASARAAQELAGFDQVRAAHVASEARIVDRHGAPLSEIRLDPRGRRLEWMGLRELSPAMLEALLAAEDRRFYQHRGVDWRAVAAALWQNLWYDRARGASTLSMQLAGLLDPALRPTAGQGGRRSLGQKWDQAVAAQALEEQWSKEQILEAYLNLAPFRGELEGLPAAAWGLFRKTPATLGRAEAAVLAVLLRGPNAAPRLVARRACQLVQRLGEAAACGEVEALAARLDKVRFEPRWNLAPELARRLLREPGEVLPTTLEREAQLVALAALGQGADGVAVVDNASGTVLALAGRGEAGVKPAPPPALLQPLAYGWALERRQISPATLLPVDAGGVGWASVRTALGAGLAGPADQVARELAPPPPDLPAVADLAALAGLYRSLAAGGQWLPPQVTAADPPAGRRLLRPEAAFLVADILAESGAPWALRVAAAEEGAVAVAFDAGISVALRHPAGVAAAATARALLAGVPHRGNWLRPPAGLVQQWVAFAPAVEWPRREWFLRGSEVALSVAPVRILGAAREALVDLREALADPDYQMRFEARPPRDDLVWRVNGADLARGPRAAWRPEEGLVHLELLDGAGQVLDQVTFAVRGP
jgi:penicillin-binding protein 1C